MAHSNILAKARSAFASGRTLPYEFRVRQLKNFIRLLEENEAVFTRALHSDLRKSKYEAVLMDVEPCIAEIQNTIDHLEEWMKPDRPEKTPSEKHLDVAINKDPYGVALVMGAWNYPIQVTLVPVAGAIAAGNCVIIKPSEISPESAQAIADLVPKYLDPECYHVVLGGVPETTALLKNRFDYIFYTGSEVVGKIVRAAANEFLTPVTLELGGKSPVYLNDKVNVDIAARRILWGKYVNAGQTCIAPDYLLCSKSTEEKFIAAAKKVLHEIFGDDAQKSDSFGRIVSDRQFKRLQEHLKCGKVALGGKTDAADRYIEPTILTDLKLTDKPLQEEIFGPVIAIHNVASATEAVNYINSREKPLALYVFTEDKNEIELFTKKTSSGGLCFNDVFIHTGVSGLPFGGVGFSGMGAYHGKYTFDTFVHHKATVISNYDRAVESANTVRYAPYTEQKLKARRLPNTINAK